MKIRSLLLIYLLPLFFCQCKLKTAPAASDIPDPLFHKWAPTPPMGWNSWDCYGPTVEGIWGGLKKVKRQTQKPT
jgi:hypothetical protein